MPEFVLEPEMPGYAKIKVIGVGGGGCNAVDWMFDTGLQNVEFYCLNTDAQALQRYKCPHKIQIGADMTRGRGCGGNPEIGASCMEAARADLEEMLRGADIVFVTAGLGGGTGTGGASVVASVARSLQILTVAVVTKPFRFEGPRRLMVAEQGLERLRHECDTIITISNDRLLEVAGAKATLREAFGVANSVLSQAVQSISDLVTIPGLINVDFNDIRAVMGDRGGAVMGIGVGKGENRASEAVKKATSSPLLEKIVIDGAQGVLVSICGGPDMTLGHINEAMSLVYESVDANAQIIFGAVVDESVKEEMRVTIIATGFPDDPHRARRAQAADAQPEMISTVHREESGDARSALASGSPLIAEAAPAASEPAEGALAFLSDTATASAPSAPAAPPAEEIQPAREPESQTGGHPFARPHSGSRLRRSLEGMTTGSSDSAAPGHAEERPAERERPAPILRARPYESATPGTVRPAEPRRPAPPAIPGAPYGAGDPKYNAAAAPEPKPRVAGITPAAPSFSAPPAPPAPAPAKPVPAAAEPEPSEPLPGFLTRRRSALFD